MCAPGGGQVRRVPGLQVWCRHVAQQGNPGCNDCNAEGSSMLGAFVGSICVAWHVCIKAPVQMTASSPTFNSVAAACPSFLPTCSLRQGSETLSRISSLVLQVWRLAALPAATAVPQVHCRQAQRVSGGSRTALAH
jgi:hypothetical protein